MTDQTAPAHQPHPAGAGGYEPWGPLATWGIRVAASLLDALLPLIGLVLYIPGIFAIVAGSPDRQFDPTTGTYEASRAGSTGLMVVGFVLVGLGGLAMIGLQLWNRVFRMGRTGQSLGKRVMGIRLVEEYTGQPMGAGMCFVRELAHTLDGFFYLGYLWPLWDAKRQTFADKILSTVVVHPRA
ncbi:hypothetical protein GCM10027517_19650 [Phycicoccus ginsengisoli]